MRTCRREAARPRRRACSTRHSSRPISASSSSTVTMLTARRVTTTSWVGAIGVSPASTTKVTSAESTASATATMPSSRTQPPGAGVAAADTSSALAVWPTLVMQTRLARPERWHVRSCRSDEPPLLPLMHLYNNVAELRQFRGSQSRMLPISTGAAMLAPACAIWMAAFRTRLGIHGRRRRIRLGRPLRIAGYPRRPRFTRCCGTPGCRGRGSSCAACCG